MIKAIYAGTFDPPTTGHMDIIKRSFKFCDELIVAVGANSSKKSMFNEQERVSLLAMTLGEFLPANKHPKVSIKTFQGLLVNFAKEQGASILIRGIRSVSDFEYEINLAGINRKLDDELETIFLPTSSELAVISSSMVKEIAKCGSNIEHFVAKGVAAEIEKKFGFIKTGDEERKMRKEDIQAFIQKKEEEALKHMDIKSLASLDEGKDVEAQHYFERHKRHRNHVE